MKNQFTILLLCLIFGDVLTDRVLKKRISGVIKAIRNKRKLEGTDESVDDSAGSPTVNSTEPYIPPTYTPGSSSNTTDNEGENGDPTADDQVVNSTKPYSQKGQNNANPLAKVQVVKFHSFKIEVKVPKIKFGVFFYFFGRKIVPVVIFRLRITYNSRLRNLQDESIDAASVKSECVITDPSMLNTELKEDEGMNVNYNCSANNTKNETNINVTLNTDVALALVSENGTTETLSFDEVNFNGNSSEESQNLQNNEEVMTGAGSLKETEYSVNKTILTLKGDFAPGNLLSENSVIPMAILNRKSGGGYVADEYNCTVLSDGLECDTTGNPLYTTVEQLHLSSGSQDGKILTVEMKNWKENSTVISTRQGNRFYSRSSSGLTGGAIAAIVIACVVAIIGASIAIIMFRKPTPPIDNTTVVELRSADNI